MSFPSITTFVPGVQRFPVGRSPRSGPPRNCTSIDTGNSWSLPMLSGAWQWIITPLFRYAQPGPSWHLVAHEPVLDPQPVLRERLLVEQVAELAVERVVAVVRDLDQRHPRPGMCSGNSRRARDPLILGVQPVRSLPLKRLVHWPLGGDSAADASGDSSAFMQTRSASAAPRTLLACLDSAGPVPGSRSALQNAPAPVQVVPRWPITRPLFAFRRVFQERQRHLRLVPARRPDPEPLLLEERHRGIMLAAARSASRTG